MWAESPDSNWSGTSPPFPAPIRQVDYSSCRRQCRLPRGRVPGQGVLRGCSCGVGGASRPAFRRARGKQAHEAQASVGQEVAEIATSRLAPGHSYAVFRSCSTISRVLSITMVRSWHCVRTGGCDGWGAKVPTSTVHQKEQDDMPGWGGRGEHGGLVQVREGSLIGGQGRNGWNRWIRHFGPATPHPPPFPIQAQANYSSAG